MAFRTNLVPDPRFLSSSNGDFWGTDSDYTFVGTGGYIDGGHVLQVSTTGFANFTTVNDANGIPVAENTDYVCSFWYNPIAVVGSTPVANINAGSAYGTNLFAASLNSAGGWQRFSTTVNSGADTLLYFRIYNNNGAVTYNYSNFQCELTSNAKDYFDGSFASTKAYRYAWTGTPDESTSTFDIVGPFPTFFTN